MSGHDKEQPGADAEFEAQLRERLRAGADDVPPDVAARLAAMRREATAEFDARVGRTRWFEAAWLPAGSLAAAAATVVLAAGLFLFAGDGSVPVMPDADDPEFAAAQDLELLEELEFLAWLEEEGHGAG